MTTPQQDFDQKRAEALASRIIEWEEIENLEEFKSVFRRALNYCSIHKCGCGVTTWMKFISMEDRLIFPELELAVMILKSATPIELSQTLEANLDMLNKIVFPISKKLLEIDTELSEPIRRKVLALSKLDMPAHKKIYKA